MHLLESDSRWRFLLTGHRGGFRTARAQRRHSANYHLQKRA